MEIRVQIPRIPAGALSNLLGLFGLIAIVVAVGGLVGVWWAVLAGGMLAAGLSALAQAQNAAEQAEVGVATARTLKAAQ